MLLFISLANFVYHNFLNGFNQFSWPVFGAIIFRTVIVGIIPFVLVYMFFLYQKVKRYEKIAIEFEKLEPMAHSSTTQIQIRGEGKHDLINIDTDQILYIQSTDNYVTIYFLDNDAISKHLLRASLSSVEEQTADTSLLRCHRSFIINLEKVLTYKPSSNGLILQLQATDTQVPVSRKYLSDIRQALSS